MTTSRRRRKTALAALAVLAVAAPMLAACSASAAPSSAQCAVIAGNGSDGSDRNFHKIVFPGQNVSLSADGHEEAQYFACGPRNYKINDGTVLDANKKQVGDRFTPTQVWTKGTPEKPSIQLNIWSTTYFTPNQSQLEKFYQLCSKYHCYTTDGGKAADANYSEPGWNGMLGENFGGTIDTGAIFALSGNLPHAELTTDSSVIQDPTQWIKLGEAMSTDFMTRVRTVTGISDVDLFCASGTGGWPDPAKPGEGEFTCNNVRVVIDKVEAADPKIRESMAAAGVNTYQTQADTARIATAKQLYGDNWSYFLGIQDTIAKCQQTDKQVCVVNLGNGSVSVPVGGNK